MKGKQLKEGFWLSPKDAAEFLGLNVFTIYRYMKYDSNPLPFYRISSSNIMIKKSELEIWVKSHK